MDDGLFLLKMAGLLCASALGVAATILGVGRDDRVPTRRSKSAIIGATAFAALTLGTHWIDIRRQADSVTGMVRQALEATARLEGNVAELERAVQPIESISMRMEVLVPMGHPLLRPYGERFEKGVAAILSTEPDLASIQRRGLITQMSRLDGRVTRPVTVGVGASHDLFPTYDEFQFARHVLDVRNVEVAFFKTPIEPREYRPFLHGVIPGPDLWIGNVAIEPFEIYKNLDSDRFFLIGNQTFDRSLWFHKTNRVASMLDIAGTQMFIAFGPLGIETLGDDFEKLLELRREFEIDALTITFGHRFRIIERSSLKRHVTRNGRVFWEYRFPSEPSGLFRN